MAIGYFTKDVGEARLSMTKRRGANGLAGSEDTGVAIPSLFVVDDDRGVAAGLASVLGSAGMKPTAYESAREFLDEADLDHAGCVLLDERLPDLSGLRVLEELRERRSVLSVVMISGFADIRMVKAALWAGAADFLEKPIDGDEMIEVVRTAWRRSHDLRQRRIAEDRFLCRLSSLTPREREVLGHILQVKSSKTIAADLGRSMKTIEVHRGRLMKKMHVQSTVELVQLCARHMGN
jgi:two-component system response regulator FixJ